MEWEPVLRSGKSNRDGRDVMNQLAYSTSGGKNRQVNFLVGFNVMKEARLQFGDYVEIFKKGDMGLIKRNNKGIGRKVSSPSGKKDRCGKIATSIYPPFVEVQNLIVLQHECTPDGIEFLWPKEGQTE